MRAQLQILSARSQALQSLCAGFDDASAMLEKLQKDRFADAALVAEYRTLCQDIEGEVVELCFLPYFQLGLIE